MCRSSRAARHGRSLQNRSDHRRHRRTHVDFALVLVASVISAVLIFAATAAIGPQPTAAGDHLCLAAQREREQARRRRRRAGGGTVNSAAAADRAAVVTIDTQITVRTARYRRATGIGTGSGFILIAANGYILTAAHVVEGASQVADHARGRADLQQHRRGARPRARRGGGRSPPAGLPAIAKGTAPDLRGRQERGGDRRPAGQVPDSVGSGVVWASTVHHRRRRADGRPAISPPRPDKHADLPGRFRHGHSSNRLGCGGMASSAPA